MKKHILRIAPFSIITLLLYSCGGVIGNIEKYPFPGISKDSLMAAVNKVYSTYPELQKTDTSMYGVSNGNSFYFVLEHEEQRFVFSCSIITYPPPYNNEIDLSLTTATTWGNRMKLAPNMGFFEKRKYRKLFEQFILPKIKQELK
jgi:hypothetical protein